MAKCTPSFGNSVTLWHDNWTEPCLKDRFPQLHSSARKTKGSIRHFLESEISRVFSLPLSVQASDQLDSLMNGGGGKMNGGG